jgi:hypothetical protein
VLDLYGGHASRRSATASALGRGADEQARLLASRATPCRSTCGGAQRRLANFCGLGLDTIFFVNRGAEANENALKLAFKMTGGTQVVASKAASTAARPRPAPLTWGAPQKWYGFPRDAVRRQLHQAEGHRPARHSSTTTPRP